MKKLFRSTSVVVFIMLLLIATVATASGGPPGAGFYSGQTIMNVGSEGDAAVNVALYDSGTGSVLGTKDYTVSEGASVTFFPGDVTASTGFVGSAIISSDQPVAGIVNVTNRLSGGYGVTGGTAASQYGGFDSASTSTTLSFPLAKQAFGVKTSAFYVQNAGSANTTFVATFKMGTSLTDPAPVTYVYTSTSIVPGQMAVIVAADAGAPAGRIGSLTLTAAQPLAGVVLEYETTTNPALILQATSGKGTASYDDTIAFPVVKKQLSGRSTGLQVQNVSGVAIDVEMVYRGAGGTCPSGTFTETVVNLQPLQSTTYLDSAILPSGCLASARATTSTPGGLLAGVVNEAFLPCSGGCVQRATMYAAFSADDATTTVVAPVYKEDFGSKITGLSVQDVSGLGATATVVFRVGASSYTYNNLVIPPGGSALLLDMTNTVVYPDANWAGGVRLPNGSLAAVTVTANQPIIAIANEAPIGSVVQDNINYEGFNR